MPTSNSKANRSAINGRFVTERYAKQHPKTTVQEIIRPTVKPQTKPKPRGLR